MLELGQPNHTFDLATIPDGRLNIRRARDGETLVTLDDIERLLETNDGVITDESDTIISLAGVMGGATTEISDSTTEVLLEMAWWDPPSISRTVKRLNLPSEASTRFRRGADWGDNIDRAMRRFIQLAAESGITAVSGFVDVPGTTPDRTPVPVRVAKVNGLLGTELTADDMAAHLISIGFEVTMAGDTLHVVVPTWRWDTATETDIAEEVGRMFGYENIPRTVPKGDDPGGLSQYQKDRRLVREVLLGTGCDETLPMPFLAPGDRDRKVLALIGKDLPLSSRQEHVVDLEEPHIGVAMRLVVGDGLQLPGKQRGAQDRLLGVERIGEGHPVLGKTRLGEIAGGEERHR